MCLQTCTDSMSVQVDVKVVLKNGTTLPESGCAFSVTDPSWQLF